jgi:hypothetical protein
MRIFILVLFFFYLVLMLRNMIKGEHTPPIEYWFLERPEVDNTYTIWWVVYGIAFFSYLVAFFVLVSGFL